MRKADKIFKKINEFKLACQKTIDNDCFERVAGIIKLKAREKIKKGDATIILWKNWCRRAKSTDSRIYGIAYNSGKKCDSIRVGSIENNNVFIKTK